MKIAGLEPMEALKLGLSEEAMGVIAENVGSTIIFESKGKMETLTLQNVIGVLPGKDRERAVVVGAHFDHMGKVGGILYPGAVDNASGVAVLIDIGRKLAGKTPDVDVVFTFWNVEEVGLQGSKAGVQQLEERYDDFCYINQDCVGMKRAGDILATGYSNDTVDEEVLAAEGGWVETYVGIDQYEAASLAGKYAAENIEGGKILYYQCRDGAGSHSGMSGCIRWFDS